jgi:hypothetical protein
MILQGRRAARRYAVSFKDASLSVAVNARMPRHDDIFVCDRAGRLYSVFHGSPGRRGRHYRRSLNGSILSKWTTVARQRRWLDHAEADQLIDDAAAHFRQLCGDLTAPDWEWLTPPDRSSAIEDLLIVLERAARFDRAAARSDAARFAAVYNPIGILPPDQYLALVLQATTGCTFNTCTFCDLYHQPFCVKTPDEFRQHVREVRDYLGDSILLRQRSIFLGAANALAVPMPRLLPLFEIIGEELRLSPSISLPARVRGWVEGVHAFLDAFTGTRKSIGDYRALAECGLRRVYIGLESGHDPLLAFVRKPGHAGDAIETVQAIKAAGIHVGVMVLIGLGGDRFAASHVADTIAALNQMRLDRGDLLYFSDLVEEPGTPYPILATQQGIRALTAIERAAQRDAIRAGLPDGGVKISNYDVREFVY